jgi:hypothetical protein
MLQIEMTMQQQARVWWICFFLKDHQIWGNGLSPVDLEAPAEEGTKMGIVAGFWCCVLCAGQS